MPLGRDEAMPPSRPRTARPQGQTAVASYAADAVTAILTASTAQQLLSAGGPIMIPAVEAVLMTAAARRTGHGAQNRRVRRGADGIPETR